MPVLAWFGLWLLGTGLQDAITRFTCPALDQQIVELGPVAHRTTTAYSVERQLNTTEDTTMETMYKNDELY